MKEMGIEREGLESRIKPFYQAHPREWKVSEYMPDGYGKSMIPEPPADISEDLSHMNSKQWKTLKKRGTTTGRRKKS